MLAVVSESFGNSIGGAKDGHGGFVADDGDVVLQASFEELAVFESEASGLGEVSGSGKNVNWLGSFVADFEVGGRDGERCGGGDAVDGLDGVDVLKGEVGLRVLVAGGEFADNVVGNVAAVAGADQDEVGVVFVGGGADKAVDAASEREN